MNMKFYCACFFFIHSGEIITLPSTQYNARNIILCANFDTPRKGEKAILRSNMMGEHSHTVSGKNNNEVNIPRVNKCSVQNIEVE